jgi:hypothetical protein
MSNIETKLKELIASGNFLEAKKMLPHIAHKKLAATLFDIGYHDENNCAYAFVCFVMLEDETVNYHCLASEIMTLAFPHLNGGYETALFHIRRAMELDPSDIELDETLLFFHSLPNKLVSDEEAQRVAVKLLARKKGVNN